MDTSMNRCDMGIVLANNSSHNWGDIVPAQLIYSDKNLFTTGVRRIIERQAAMKTLHMTDPAIKFTPAAIIMDDIGLDELDFEELDTKSTKDLKRIFDDLSILVETASPSDYSDTKLFPLTWQLLCDY